MWEDAPIAITRFPMYLAYCKAICPKPPPAPGKTVEVILDNTLLYNNITEIITKEYAIMNEIQSY